MSGILKYAALCCVLAASQRVDAEETARYGKFAEGFSVRLGEIDFRLRQIEAEMLTLPVMSDIDARGTHGFHSNFSPESEEHWLEIQWDEPQSIDGIGMIPTRITTQSGLRSNYGFPARVRIEATRRGETERFVLREVHDTRLDLRHGEPLFLNLKAEGITSLRVIPIDSATLPGENVRFFSLAELMVYQGQRNIAHGAKLRANSSIDGEEGWNIQYLVDERSSLGPPELPEPVKSLGWHSRLAYRPKDWAWAIIDLGASVQFDSIRLVGARVDAPIKGPGFGFPAKFRFEVSDDGLQGTWTPFWKSGDMPVTSPGYNPMTVHFPAARGRYVRLAINWMQGPDPSTVPRILLSEMEVLDGLRNLAIHCPVSTSDGYSSIPHDANHVWSSAGLTDGYSSSGRLIPERDWVSSLSRRFDLICEKAQLESEQTGLMNYWRRLSLVVMFCLLAVAVLGLLYRLVRQHRVNRHKMLVLRGRISSDLHDEVGSNLATISLLSELGPSPENLDDINRLSRETSLALREIVEINLASKRARAPFGERLRDIATLMLRDHEWTFDVSDTPLVDLEQRKNLVFFFKESLHNIIRHAQAKNVRITFDKVPPDFRLHIEDDGRGIEETSSSLIGNFSTLRQRAASLGGTLEVRSENGRGTRLTLLFPIHSRR